jgi:hypothetical protein
MAKEETSQYAIKAILRAATWKDIESNLDRLEYSQ